MSKYNYFVVIMANSINPNYNDILTFFLLFIF